MSCHKHIAPLILVFLLGISSMAIGQQDPQYSQYMFNGLVINPAYAGSREQLSAVMLVRKQWVGVEGSPTTFSFGAHAPTRNKRHGIGGMLVSDVVGFTRNIHVNFTYAFRIPIKKSWLSFGLLAGLTNYRLDLASVRTRDQGDLSFDANNVSLLLPNAGAGVYFQHKHFYLGVSAPNLVAGRIYSSARIDQEARRFNHYLFTAGGMIGLGKSLKFKPSALVKFVKAAPVSLDLNASFLIKDMVWLGVSWRMEDAVVFIFEWQITRQFRIGYSYDYTTSELSNYSSGSHEVMLGLDLDFKKKKMASPRYF